MQRGWAMMLRRRDVDRLIEKAGAALQALQDEFDRENVAEARVRFPRGFIHTAAALRSTLPDLGTDIQQKNASYSLLALDVLRWLVVRTDLSGAALSMIVKESIVIVGALCEWMSKEATRGHGSRKPYSQRTQALVDLGHISADLKTELDWVWKVRCNVHMHEVTSLEYDMYSREEYNRAARAYRGLRDSLLDRTSRDRRTAQLRR